jgi:hypothetical protein
MRNGRSVDVRPSEVRKVMSEPISATARASLGVALACLALISGLLSSAPIAHAASSSLLYTQPPCAPVYTAPSKQSLIITQLLGGTDVTATGEGGASGWTHVRIWSGIDGYIPSPLLGPQQPGHPREGVCNYPGLPDAVAEDPPADAGPASLNAKGVTVVAAPLYAQPDANSQQTATLAPGQAIAISQWAAGPGGQPWYQASAGGKSGWIWSAKVKLSIADPAKQQVNGQPIWQPIAGKGMWFTNYLPHHSDVDQMMRAAKLAGITHVYAEVAITPYGFYARDTLNRLIPAAHKQGIAVIAWVYPYLRDVSLDVRLTKLVADYVTPTGERADGVAADIEEVIDRVSVYSYGQLTRALLGDDTLMVAAVFHPRAEPDYPYDAIAASWNVLAPMDYWHSRASKLYGRADVARFVAVSIITIRAAMGNSQLPIEELGQTYNMFTDDFTGGATAPGWDEMIADMDVAKDYGCIGVSFFEWQTATQEQWQAVSRYPW